jgi:hypothetical protein
MRLAARRILGLAIVALPNLGVPRASAQMVEAGITRDAKLGMPLECLHVALLDSTGRAVAHTVTDSAGRFQLEATTPGAYRVQFLVHGWEPLAGPVDTLAEGSFKQRIYPLAFANILVLDTVFVRPVNEMTSQERRERSRRYEAYLRRLESDSGWRSRRVVPQGIELAYPDRLRREGVDGTVLAYFIVDSTGRARPQSWRTLSATDPGYENAVRSSLPRSRWKPALRAGHASCELTLDFARFYSKDGVGHIVLQTR